MTPYKLYLFGPPRMEGNGEIIAIPLRKAVALLAYLAVTGQPQRRDILAAMLWPEKDQRSARANLRRTIYELGQQLEKVFGIAWIEADEEIVKVSPHISLWTDVVVFQQVLTNYTGEEAGGSISNREPSTDLMDAMALYTDDFLAGFTLSDAPDFDDWQFFQRETYRRQFAATLQQIVAWHEEQANYEEAVRFARRWLQLDPLEEAVHRRLMALYARNGQVAAAVRQYDECTRLLHEELDVPPETETFTLFEAIRTRQFPEDTRRDRDEVEESPNGKEIKRQNEQLTQVSDSQTLRIQTRDNMSADHLRCEPLMAPATTVLRHNLPQQTTPFVGRKQEIEEILHRLSEAGCRLLTLIGPGGIGKTRLALEVAQRLAVWQWPTGAETQVTATPLGAMGETDNTKLLFPDGIYLVELQTVQSPSGILAAVATAMDFRFYPDMPPDEQLIQFLYNKRILIVLDNLEHLLTEFPLAGGEVTARLISGLLADAPQVKLLVTSREALKLQEEWFHPLGGMRFSQARHKAIPTEGETPADAVQLFIQSARRAQANFDATKEYGSIVRICRLVDGVPLALELAAAWLKVLPCPEIANEIVQNLDILTTRHQNIPIRHRSMRAVLEQSWQLLSEEEQRVLQRLSVFHRGCTQEAARTVAETSLFLLVGLTEKALIRVVKSETVGLAVAHNRYLMHELLRQFVAEKLEQSNNRSRPEKEPGKERGSEQKEDEAQATRRKHSDYYLTKLQQQANALLGAQQQQASQNIAAELDNLRAALLWAIRVGGGAQTLQSLDLLYNFYQIQSRYSEGKEFFVEALKAWHTAENTISRASHQEQAQQVERQLLARIGALCYLLCDYTAADRYLNEALVLAHAGFNAMASSSREDGGAAEEERERAFILHFLGQLSIWKGEQAQAIALLTESLQLSRILQDMNHTADALEKLAGLVYATFGDYEKSKQLALESLVLSRQLGRPGRIAYALDTLGFITFCLGEYEESEVYYRESLAIFERNGDLYGQAMALGGLGLIYWGRGHPALIHAANYFRQSLAICRQLGHHGQISGRLVGLARVANDQGTYVEAKALAEEALAVVRHLKIPIYHSHALYCLGESAYQLGDLTTARDQIIEALQLTVDTGLEANLATILYHYAMLLLHGEKQRPEAPLEGPRYHEAWRLFTLVRAHPATWHVYRTRAARQVTLLAGQLKPTPTASPTATVGESSLEIAARAILSGDVCNSILKSSVEDI